MLVRLAMIYPHFTCYIKEDINPLPRAPEIPFGTVGAATTIFFALGVYGLTRRKKHDM